MTYAERLSRIRELAREAWPGVPGIVVETQVDQNGVHSFVVSFEPEQDVFDDVFILSGVDAEWVLEDAETCIGALAQARARAREE